MTRSTKKEMERRFLDAVLKELGFAPTAVEQRESPDFIIVLPTLGRVGIELTFYTSSEERRRIEAAWDKFIEATRDELRKYPWMEGVSVSLWFEPLRLPSQRDWPAFIAEIANFLCPMVPNLERQKARDIDIPAKGFPLMQTHLRFIDAGRPGIYIEWTYNGNVGHVGVTDVELSNIVADKADKARRSYSAGNADALWLMIHGGWTISQILEPLDAEQLQSFTRLTKHLNGIPFDRVYLVGSSTFCWLPKVGWHSVQAAH